MQGDPVTPQTKQQLEAIAMDMGRWCRKHGSPFIAALKQRLDDVLMDEGINGHASITPCERVSYEKCLDRIDEEVKRVKGQINHTAFGPQPTKEQSIYMKDLRTKRKEILGKLGLPV